MPRRSAQPPQPPEHLADRLRRLRHEMRDRKLSAVLATSLPDQFYLTGFDGEDGAALITPRAVHLITDGRFDQQADVQAPWARKLVRKGPLEPAIARLAGRFRLARIGLQPDTLTLQQFRQLAAALKTTRLAPAPDLIHHLRMQKDPTEIQAIRRAVAIAERAFVKLRPSIRPGQTERQIAARLEYLMRTLGADGPSFPTIVAVGPNASLPHARAGDQSATSGSAILIDWGARLGMYCSDLTRVLFVGRIPPRLGKLYQVVLDAQLKAIQAIKPHVAANRVDAVARRRIRAAGFGQNFRHGLGHGLGLQVHEQPRIAARSKTQLLPGMVFTVEPGIYLPGLGGVRIEDDVAVTPDGVQVLSTLTKDLQSMVL